MKVLFYIEPLTEREAPKWKRGWLDFAARMARAIEAERPGASFAAIVGDGLEADAANALADARVEVLRHAELVPRFGTTALQVATGWYRGGTASSTREMGDLVRRRLRGFAPDVCITLSPAPFLRDAFAAAPVLHFELGIVSRPPFPFTGYLDPIGMFMQSFIGRYAARVSGFEATPDETRVVQLLREGTVRQIAEMNPLSLVAGELAQGYRQRVLLALQFSNFYAYDAHATYPEQYDLLVQTLEATPREVGVFVTEHPQHPLLTDDTLAHLRATYPNFFWSHEFRETPAASQYLLGHVDCVVTVSSSVGWQALLWKKPLVVVGHSHLDLVADSNDLQELPALLRKPRRDDPRKERVLAWHLNRYASPFDVLFGKAEVVKRIERAIDLHRKRRLSAYFDKPFSNAADLLAAYGEAIKRAGASHSQQEGAHRVETLQAQLTEAHRSGEAREADRLQAWQLVEKLQARLAALEAEHGAQTARLHAEHQTREDDRVAAWKAAEGLNVAVRLKEQQIATLGAEIAALRSQLQSQGESSARLTEQLQTRLASLQADHEKQLANLFADHQRREDDRVAAWRAAEALKVTVQAKDDRARALEATAAEMRKRLESEAHSAQRFESELAAARLRLAGLERDLAVASAAASAVQEGSKAAQVSLAAALGRRDAEIAGLRQQFGEISEQCSELKSERAVLGAANEQAARDAAHRDEQLQALRSEAQRLSEELRSAQLRADQIEQSARGDRYRAQAIESQLEAIYRSRSWRMTTPLRSVGQQARSMRGGTRRLLLRASQAVWRRLPLNRAAKDALKARAFLLLAPLIGHTGAFRRWQEYERVRAEIDAQRDRAPVAAEPFLPAAPVAARTAGLPELPEPVPVPLTAEAPLVDASVTLVAFYLPQFHPIPENDAWWGAGFTEWTNVTRARPQFVGHYQPHVPGELGYYDLRVPEVQRRQVELAKLYGVGAFCFYFYWFAGHRLLERPILQYLSNTALDLPFCLCWANENWSRRWDGLDQELLISQKYSSEDDIAFIEYLSRYLRDRRYLRVAGRPLVLVYRPSLLPDSRATAERWRQWCRANGIGEIFLAYTQSFSAVDPAEYGFDAAIEFPPNNSAPPDITDKIERLNPSFKGVVYDWRVLVERSRNYAKTHYRLYRGVNPSWDNEARKSGRGAVLYGSTPEAFREWVRNAAVDTVKRFPHRDERLVFVNAWNEWAEGAHLEPDRRYGYAWLQATRDGLLEAACDNNSPNEQSKTTVQPHLAVPCSGPAAAAASRRLVLVTHDAYPHGAQFLALHLAEAFVAELKIAVDIVVLGDGPLKADFARHGTVHDLAGIDPEGDHARQLVQQLRAAGATSALCNTAVSGKMVGVLKAAGIHCVSLIHEMPGILDSYGLAGHAATIAQSADCVVFPAQIVATGFTRFAPLEPERVQIRPQGLYKRNRFAGYDDRSGCRSELRQRLGLAPDARIVLGVGYADHRKGIDLFVAAGERLVSRRDDVYFVWVGHHDATLWPQIEEQLHRSRHRDRFLFPGRFGDTDVFYAGADVFALTSREDPFPSVVMESLEVQVPIVAFADSGGCCDLIADGCGLLVAPFDADAFADAVERLLGDAALAARLGGHGAHRVREEFSFRRYVLDLASWLHLGLLRVSVIVPNYNYAQYLKDRLASIGYQSHPVYEMIVLDDASTDDSVAVIEQTIGRGTVDARVVVNSKNSGSVFKQWQKGVELATGDLVWIAEADDLADPGFLAETAAAFADPAVVMSYCQSRQMSSDGTVLCEHYLDYTADISPEKWTRAYVAEGVDEIRTALAVKNTVPNVSAVVFRRAALVAALDECASRLQQLKVAGDWLVYVSVLNRGRIAFTPAPLNSHRRHQGSVTLANFNLMQLHEIVSMQQEIRRRFATSAEVHRRAAKYAQQLFEQFGLQEGPVRRVEEHPLLASALAE